MQYALAYLMTIMILVYDTIFYNMWSFYYLLFFDQHYWICIMQSITNSNKNYAENGDVTHSIKSEQKAYTGGAKNPELFVLW